MTNRLITFLLSAACVAPALSQTPPIDQHCIEPVDGGLFIGIMGGVDVHEALSDVNTGSLMITSKVDHIVEVRMTWQTLGQSGITPLYPAGTDGFHVVLYNPNRVDVNPVSVYEINQTQGFITFEPGGPDDIFLTVIDNDGQGVTSGGGSGVIFDVCDDGTLPCDNPHDRNCDGVLDLEDIAGIIECILSGDAACDCNGDGVTSVDDIYACLDEFDDDGDPPCPE